MKRVVTATELRKLNAFLADIEGIKILEHDIEYQEELFSKLDVLEPDVLLIADRLPGPFGKYELAEELIKLKGNVKLIFILKEPDDTTFIKFLKEKGIRDTFNIFTTDVQNELLPAILFEDPIKEEIKEVINREIAVAIDEDGLKAPEKIYVKKGVIAVATAGGGGIGKTTIATNVAVKTAVKHPQAKIIILDYNDEKPDVARMFNIPEKKGLEGLVKAIKEDSFNTSMILKNLEPYDSSIPNLYVLPGIKNMMDSDLYTLSHYRYVIDVLKKEADLLVIDTGAFKSVATHAALEKATNILFLVRDTETTIHSLKDKTDFYRKDLSMDIMEKTEILMNMTIGYEDLDEKAILKIFGKEPIGNIRFNSEISFFTEKYKAFVLEKGKKFRHETNTIEKIIDSLFKFKYVEEEKGLIEKLKAKVGL